MKITIFYVFLILNFFSLTDLIWVKEDVNLGILAKNTSTIVRFVFTNKSNKIIEIKSVKTSCGCTSSSFSKTTGVGKIGYVELKYDSNGNKGNVEQYAIVVTNSKLKYYKLSFKANIK